MKARKAQEICLHANGHILTWMCEAGAHVTFRHFWMKVDSVIVGNRVVKCTHTRDGAR